MDATQGFICLAGFFSIPIFVFFIGSICMFWFAQSIFVSLTGIHIEDVPRSKTATLAYIASFVAAIIAVITGGWWASGNCVGLF